MLDEAALRFLTPEQQARLRDYESLFGTPGWQRLQKELQESVLQIRNNAINLTNEKELYFAKGQAAAIFAVLNRDKVVKAEYEGLVADAELSREEARAGYGANA